MVTLLVNQMPLSAGLLQQQVLPQGWRAEYEHSLGRWYYVDIYTGATQWDLPVNPAGQGPNTRPVEPHSGNGMQPSGRQSIPSSPHDPNQSQDRGLFSPSSNGDQPKGFLGRVLQGKPPFQLSQQLRNLAFPTRQAPCPASVQAQPTYGPPQGQRPQSMSRPPPPQNYPPQPMYRPQQGYPPPQQSMSSPYPPAQAQGNRTGMGTPLSIGAGAGIGGGLLGRFSADKAAGSWPSQQSSVAAPPMNPSNYQNSYGGQGGYDQGYYNSTSASPDQELSTTQDSYAPMDYGQGGGHSQAGANVDPSYGQQQQQQLTGYDQQGGSYSQGGNNSDPDGQQQQQNGYDQQGGGGDYRQRTDDYSAQYDQQGGYDQGYNQQDDNYQQQTDAMDADADMNALEAQDYENAAALI